MTARFSEASHHAGPELDCMQRDPCNLCHSVWTGPNRGKSKLSALLRQSNDPGTDRLFVLPRGGFPMSWTTPPLRSTAPSGKPERGRPEHHISPPSSKRGNPSKSPWSNADVTLILRSITPAAPENPQSKVSGFSDIYGGSCQKKVSVLPALLLPSARL